MPAVDDVVYLSPPALGQPAPVVADRFPIAVDLNPAVCSRGDQTSRHVHWHSPIVTDAVSPNDEDAEYGRTSWPPGALHCDTCGVRFSGSRFQDPAQAVCVPSDGLGLHHSCFVCQHGWGHFPYVFPMCFPIFRNPFLISPIGSLLQSRG